MRWNKQRLKALQAVNSAQANAQAKQLGADAEAYRIKKEAEAKGDAVAYRLRVESDARAHRIEVEAMAEAEAIRLVNEQLAKNTRYIDLAKAKKWDGQVPRTVLGENGNILFSVK